jgi:hypothetical protein
MQKISKLILKDFKFFNGEISLDFERKNILIYGENGSGKSGVYWALYTFIQSVYKTDVAQIRKYFDPKSGEDLINFYSKDKRASYVKVFLSDGKSKPSEKEISLSKITTRKGDVVKNIAQASDFLNYRFLFEVYNFRNSQDIELFSIFERDLLLFINFPVASVRHDAKPGSSNGGEWWKYLSDGLDSSFGKQSPQFTAFDNAIKDFDKEFKSYLENIIYDANIILNDKFKETIKLSIDYVGCAFDYRKNIRKPTYQKPSPPKVKLKAELVNKNLPAGKEDVKRLQTFLNEAKLTAIALSIRLAVLDEKYIKDTPRILVLDDLLISLDMSNREKVLDIIFDEYIKNTQMIILTHDKSFFELVRREISYKSQTDDWVLYEMFVDDKDGFEKPFIAKTKTLLAKSRNYFAEKDYPACANHLRQAAEEILERLVPTIHRKNKEGDDIVVLGSLTGSSGQLYKAEEYFRNRENLSDLIPYLQKIDKYKDTLLNPLSHYNAYSQVYRGELKTTINVLTAINELRNDVIIPVDKYLSIKFQSQKGVDYEYIARLEDDIRLFKYPNQVSFWGKCKLMCVGFSNPSKPNYFDVSSYSYPILEISVFYNRLAKYTKSELKKIDPTDDIIIDDFQSAISVVSSNKPLIDLKTY